MNAESARCRLDTFDARSLVVVGVFGDCRSWHSALYSVGPYTVAICSFRVCGAGIAGLGLTVNSSAVQDDDAFHHRLTTEVIARSSRPDVAKRRRAPA